MSEPNPGLSRGPSHYLVIYDEAVPERQPLLPDTPSMSNVEVTWVAQPGGPVHPAVTPYVREILESQMEPLLYVTFDAPGGRRTTLIEMSALRRRGLPTDYETLSAMYPEIRWSAR